MIIVGAGPAGLTAGLYAGRYRLKTLVVEKMMVGGQIMLSSTIENFPGFPGGIPTQDLIDRMKQQLDGLGVEIKNVEAASVASVAASRPRVYRVSTPEGDFESRSIIVSTGAHWKRLGVPGEEKLIGRGVSFCGTCDGPLFRNKEVCVIGGGDKAIEEAIFLTKYASKVMVIHRRNSLRATEILQEQAKANPKISFILDSVVEAVIGENRVEGLKLRHVHTNLASAVSCQGVFIFIGIQPSTEFLAAVVKMDEAGFIIIDTEKKTSMPGIFACGDCTEKHLYQVITACAEGAEAAHSAHNYLLHNGT
ncbi:MAG: thioredoxin-disulfide reductase [Candidatus Omnitrophica bacterium]|nr:thioredoxin-disulfide reductase [Candidatus Omnitrophota bacterium]